MPREIRIATIWKKSEQNKGELEPDFCLYDTNEWLVFPYELTGLTLDEIKAHKPYAAKFINTKSLEK